MSMTLCLITIGWSAFRIHETPSPLTCSQRDAVVMDSQLFPAPLRAKSPAPEAMISVWHKPEDDESSTDGIYRSVGLSGQGYFWAIHEYRPDLFSHLTSPNKFPPANWIGFGLDLTAIVPTDINLVGSSFVSSTPRSPTSR